jgi:hypothetical protein
MNGWPDCSIAAKKFFLYTISSVTHMREYRGARLLSAPLIFALFWVALFVLYMPAARSGWVSDTLGWLEAVRTQSFPDFVNRKGFSVPSYYQLTQAVTWCLYQVLGANRWAWHLLQLSLHALNATLLFTLLRGIFKDSKIGRAEMPAFIAAALFCTSPYVSEVIVWEAAYHFLQGLLLLLAQLHFMRRFLHKQEWYIGLVAVMLFGLSLFSLELFYLTPFLNAALCIHYRYALHWNSAQIKKAWLRIVIPQAGLLLCYFIGLRIFAGATTGRLGNDWAKLPVTYFLVKPQEYLFHLLGGRFLPQSWRSALYLVCSSYAGAGIFYVGVGVVVMYILMCFRKMQLRAQLISVLTVWLLLSVALVTPLWFPERLLIVGDRYLYVLLPPFFALLVLIAGNAIGKPLLKVLACLLLLCQILFACKLNCLWRESTRLTDRLQGSLRDAPGRITILLNSPASLRGALMIGAGSDGEARLMHHLFFPGSIGSPMYDAPAQNLLHPTDSIRIQVLDAGTIRVSLTQPGAFWQYGADVAHTFHERNFSVVVENPDCCYTLHLADLPDKYRLLYQQSGIWHEFHMQVTGREMP